MSNSIHFFIKPDNFFQCENQKFGPLDNSSFRTNALFTINSDTEAYAVCNGHLLIFDNEGDESLVNLIILTSEDTPENFTPKVKYFIYRGLRRDNFMSGNSRSTYRIITITEAVSKGLSFMVSLLSKNPKLELSSLYCNDNDGVIHNVFLENFVPVKKGTFLGFYKKISGINPAFGVVLNDQSYLPSTINIEFANSKDHKILVSFNSSFNPGDEKPDVLAQREKIHLFMDPAAFWAIQNNTGISTINSSDKITYNANDHPNEFYSKFIEKFYTKKFFYIDIRNFLDYSLNYYKDQAESGNNLSYNIGARTVDQNTTFISSSYYTNYWPIKIIELPETGNNNFTILNLRFLTKTTSTSPDIVNFKQPIIYLDYGVVKETCEFSQGSGFQSVTQIKKFGLALLKRRKLIIGKTIQLIIPCVSNSNKNKLPWYSKMYYFDGVINDNNKYHKTTMDYVFGYIEGSKINDVISGSVGGFKYSVNRTYHLKNLSESHRYFVNRKVCIPIGPFNQSTPLIVQTGIGLSQESVIYYAKVISEDPIETTNNSTDFFQREKISIEQNACVSDNTNIIIADTEIKAISYSKFVDPILNINLLYQNQSNLPLEFQLHIAADEIFSMQNVIIEKTNTNLLTGGNPIDSDLNINNHELRFVFEPFIGGSSNFGSSFLKLKGFDSLGNQIILQNLQPQSAQLYVKTVGGFTFFTSKGVALDNYTSIERPFNTTNYHPEFLVIDPIPENYDLVKILKLTHRKYLDNLSQSSIDSGDFMEVEKFISVWRRYYYGRYDKSGDELIRETKRSIARNFFLFEPLDMAIPSAFEAEGVIVSSNTYLRDFINDFTVNELILSYLLSKGNENGIGDNPSPYIIDSFNKKIDLGHLLYGLDGLINDYNTTHANYKLLGIMSSNDLTGYVADVATAAAESRIYKNEKKNDTDLATKFYYPINNDINRLYEISCPDADLYSDVDAFGLFNVYKFFTENPNHALIPVIKGKKIVTIDFLFHYYYDPNFSVSNLTNYPIDANYKLRWLNFCRAYKAGDAVNSSSSSNALIYQGYVENVNGEYLWVADTPSNGNEHASISLLRKRLESFAHFWYQFTFNKKAIAGVLDNAHFKGGVLYDALQRNSDQNNPIRFERVGQLSLPSKLSKYLENQITNPSNAPTSPIEINEVMNIFLTRVKAEFNNEKSINSY